MLTRGRTERRSPILTASPSLRAPRSTSQRTRSPSNSTSVSRSVLSRVTWLVSVSRRKSIQIELSTMITARTCPSDRRRAAKPRGRPPSRCRAARGYPSAALAERHAVMPPPRQPARSSGPAAASLRPSNRRRSRYRCATDPLRPSVASTPIMGAVRSVLNGEKAARRALRLGGRSRIREVDTTGNAGPWGKGSVPLAHRPGRGGVGADGIGHVPALGLGAVEEEAGLLGRPVDNEGEAKGLPAGARVEGRDADVAVAEDLPALLDLVHHAGRVLQVEHRQAPHLPVGVPGVRVVRVLDVHGPAPLHAVVGLLLDLVGREVREEGEGPLGHSHVGVLAQAAVGVGTKSGVSVEV